MKTKNIIIKTEVQEASVDFSPYRAECKKIILSHTFKLSIDKKLPYKKKFEKLTILILDFISSVRYFNFDDLINDIKKQFKLKFESFVVSVENPALFKTQRIDKLCLSELVERLEFYILSDKVLLEKAGLSCLHEYDSIANLKKYKLLLKTGTKRDKQYKTIHAIIVRKEKGLADLPDKVLKILQLALDNPLNIVNKEIMDTFKNTFLSDINSVNEWLKKANTI